MLTTFLLIGSIAIIALVCWEALRTGIASLSSRPAKGVSIIGIRDEDEFRAKYGDRMPF